MTKEEKAKAYDEALEKAKELLDSPRTCFDIEQLKDIFSELAESEDERIRRKMIEHFKSKTKDTWCNMPVKDILAYLEKQKEYELTEEDKKIIPEALVMLCNDIINHRVHTPIKTDEEGARKIKAFLKTFNRQPYKTKEEWEKQKEQKPAEVDVKALLTADRLASAEITGRLKERSEILENPEKYGLRKPAEWSDYKDKVNVPYCSSEPEWSEEDEKNLKSVVSTLWFALNTPHFPLNYDRIIELETWLKSLRPSWKPSEEQMRYLLAVINEPNNAGSESCHLVLKELYEKLKTL